MPVGREACVCVCVCVDGMERLVYKGRRVGRSGREKKRGADRTYVQQKRKKKVEYVDQRKETK